MEKPGFETIIPTALHTAYPLIFTDIPYAKEMYEGLQSLGFPENLKNEKLAIELEARYKLTDHLLLNYGGESQVIELACGYTTRGLDLCQKHKHMKYVEVDLPQVIETKTKLLKSFTILPGNFKMVAGNALDFETLNKICQNFDTDKPIIIINQGLMRYLDFDEKRKLAENIYKIISKNDGIWITCDVTPANWVKNQDKNMSNYNKNLAQVTERNNPSWRFKDRNHVTEFFGELGFEIEWHDFIEAKPMLSSPKIHVFPMTKLTSFLQERWKWLCVQKNKRKLKFNALSLWRVFILTPCKILI